jgi:hypothetical protein
MSGFLLDTDILSLFAKVDALPLLCRLLGRERLPITPGVLNEIVVPLEYGYTFPQRILALAEMVLMTPGEVGVFEELRLEGEVSAADAEMIAICQQRGWIYVTLDRVAARCAEARGVRTVDLRALLEAIRVGGLLEREALRVLVEQMERADHTTFPYKDAVLGDGE